MPMHATKRWTVEEVQALPDDGMRYEVVDGELLVTPAPTWTHGEAVQELQYRLRDYLRAVRVGHVKVAPADVVLGARTLVQPDLFVVPLVQGRRPADWEEAGRMLLAVEVLSPGTARRDRILKRELYQRLHVPEYWIVDVDARAIERWRPDDVRGELLADRIAWRPERVAEPLVIELGEYFADVLGESRG
ncbi:MAG TPA: Uma2 family endonuclease [Gemmatimonadaceae bacterium]